MGKSMMAMSGTSSWRGGASHPDTELMIYFDEQSPSR
jgi:hypothetical protein